ncbi:MAG: hypothetical protein ABEJ87_01215 [Candidatus Nanohalobium sp.]
MDIANSPISKYSLVLVIGLLAGGLGVQTMQSSSNAGGKNLGNPEWAANNSSEAYKPVSFNWFSPKASETFNSYKAEFKFDVETQKEGNATLYVEGEKRFTKHLDPGLNLVKKEISFSTEGTKNYRLKVISNGKNFEKTGSFTVKESLPPLKINIENPEEGMKLDSHGLNIEFSVDSTEKFRYSVKLDGRELKSLSLLPSQGESLKADAICVSKGQHDLKIIVKGKESGRTTQKSISFETTEKQPIAEIDFLNPKEGTIVSSPVDFGYKIKACENVQFTVSTSDTQLESGSIDKGDSHFPPKSLHPEIEAGNKTLTVSVSKGSRTFERKINYEVEN